MLQRSAYVLLVSIGLLTTAHANEKLDALLQTWIGYSSEEVIAVWGNGISDESTRGNLVLIYNTANSGVSFRVAGIPTGQTTRTCSVRFEFVDLRVIAFRVRTPDGSNSRQCWRAFRKNTVT